MELSKDYIDADGALKRIGGNKGLYIKLLNQLLDGGHIESLEQALGTGDFETAGRGAHSIKGVGANLSLPALAAVALELEQKIKSNEDYSDCFNNLKNVYDITSQQIAAYCREEGDA